MNVLQRQRLIEVLRDIRQSTCAYDAYYGPNNTPRSGYCDCKFTLEGESPHLRSFGTAEMSGCPEIGNAIVLLEALTDEQYDFLLRGSGHTFI